MALGKSKEVELTTLVEVLGANSDANGEDSRSTERFLVLSSTVVCVAMSEDVTWSVCVCMARVSGMGDVLQPASV